MEKPLHILIVEDDEVTWMAYKRMFSSWNKEAHLVHAQTIAKAIHQLADNQFDSVVLDYQLPDGDAFEILPQIRNIPIIFVSGMEDISIAVKAIKEGAQDYLVKDINNNFVETLPFIVEKSIRNHQTESELRKTERRYSDLFENSNDMIQSVNSEGSFLHVNPAWLRVMGYQEEEVSQLHFLDIIQPEEHEHCKQVFQQLMQGKTYQNEQIGFLTKSGKRVLVEGNIFANREPNFSTIGIFRDITERKESELQLLEAKARYDLAVDAGKTGIMDWNLATDHLFIDDKLKLILGFDPQELESTMEGWYGQVHPEHKEKVAQDLRKFITGDIPNYEFEYKMLNKEHKTCWIMARANAIRDEKGLVVRIIGTGTDITVQKQIQAELELRENQLRNINDNLESLVMNRTKKLSESNEYLEREVDRRKLTESALEEEKTRRVSALIAGQEIERKRLAKELHDSLGQLLTAAKIQVRQTIKRAENKELKEKVKYTGEILDLTIQEVRKISQALMPVLLHDFGLAIAIEKMVEQLSKAAPSKMEYTFIGSKNKSFSKEIEIALFRICQEALNNSLKYSNASNIRVVFEISDHLINLSISDDGDGIGIDELHGIYNTPNGHGIYNMKERADLINAEFTLNSDEGKGTSIEITIPL